MAEQEVALNHHPELQQFMLHDAILRDKEVGRGAYGSVVEVEIPGAVCVAKRIHELLQEGTTDEVRHMTDRFSTECLVLSSLRHPHIVQFLGLCQLPGSLLPALVMERLDRCLHSLLEATPNIPRSAKLSILSDVAKGLVYLHSRTPPIIHRDLTARNVLLSSSMVAKISDLGMARLVNIQPGQLAATMTKTPGNFAYMPPEAFETRPTYNIPLDIFSFGVLALFVLSQKFPCNPSPATYTDRDTRQLVARSEVDRRIETMDILYREFGKEHPMVLMVHDCLNNLPEERPTATQLLDRVTTMQSVTPNYTWDMNKMEMVMDIEAKERELQEREEEIKELHALNDTSILQSPSQLQEIDHDHEKKVAAQKHAYRQTSSQLEASTAVAYLQPLMNELCTQQELHEDVTPQADFVTASENKSELQKIEELPEEDPKAKMKAPKVENVTFTWKTGRIQPHKLTSASKAVVLHNNIYIVDGNVVRVYSLERDVWNTLPQCPTHNPSIVVANEKVVLISGLKERVSNERHRPFSNLVSVWDNGEWTHPYPPLPTPQVLATAVAYKHYIIVAGGMCMGGKGRWTRVEILDTKASKWFTAKPLPVPCVAMDAVIIDDTLYLAGGYDYNTGRKLLTINNKVRAVSLPALIAQTVSDEVQHTRVPWKTIPDTPLRGSTFFTIGNVLMCAGGLQINSVLKALFSISKRFEVCSDIYRYDPEAKSWVLVSHLPNKCKEVLSAVLSSGELVILGGVNNVVTNLLQLDKVKYSDMIYIANVCINEN